MFALPPPFPAARKALVIDSAFRILGHPSRKLQGLAERTFVCLYDGPLYRVKLAFRNQEPVDTYQHVFVLRI